MLSLEGKEKRPETRQRQYVQRRCGDNILGVI